jgi:hypothetical protein
MITAEKGAHLKKSVSATAAQGPYDANVPGCG